MTNVARLLRVCPWRGPGFSVIGISTNSPGGIGASGALAVVQPQLVVMRLIFTGLSVALVTLALIVLGTSAWSSPRSSTGGSNRTAALSAATALLIDWATLAGGVAERMAGEAVRSPSGR